MHHDAEDAEAEKGDRKNSILKNPLLYRPQLKVHNSMLKVINCISNSLWIFSETKSNFDRNEARKTNVTVWPCCCPFRSIKINAISRESVSSFWRQNNALHRCFLSVATLILAFLIKLNLRMMGEKNLSWVERPKIAILTKIKFYIFCVLWLLNSYWQLKNLQRCCLHGFRLWTQRIIEN